MTVRKRFTDTAGFTRHCWECIHAKNWRKGFTFGGKIDGNVADCELTKVSVGKFDSPNNQCSQLPITCNYETR